METDSTMAFCSMAIALEAGMPTYSGGLGGLAGDTVRAAADLHIPMVAVTLLHCQGYFPQRLRDGGEQHEEPVVWAVNDCVRATPARAVVTVEGRTVPLRAWQDVVCGMGDCTVPVYFFDAALPDNTAWDRTMTDGLYDGGQRGFISVMRHAIALNGSFFNTQRMMQQYVVKAYFL
jgi:starch phosphorylase